MTVKMYLLSESFIQEIRSGWCAAGSMGWCMRLGPALVWGSSMHRCLRRGGGGGPIEAG